MSRLLKAHKRPSKTPKRVYGNADDVWQKGVLLLATSYHSPAPLRALLNGKASLLLLAAGVPESLEHTTLGLK